MSHAQPPSPPAPLPPQAGEGSFLPSSRGREGPAGRIDTGASGNHLSSPRQGEDPAERIDNGASGSFAPSPRRGEGPGEEEPRKGVPPSQTSALAIRIGSDAFLVDMSGAGEIVPAPAVTPVPWTHSWFRGITNVRGRLIGVIDLQELGGGTPLAPEQAGQLVVLHPGLRYNIGLLATRAFGLRNRKDLTAQGASHHAARPWETTVWRDADGTRMTEVDLQRLMEWDAFANIGI